MTTVNIADAKSQFAELVRRAENGEIIVLSRNDKPVARLGPLPLREGGFLKGVVEHDSNWWEPSDELADLFEGTEQRG